MNKLLFDSQRPGSQESSWCPGCGDFAILEVLKKSLEALGENATTDGDYQWYRPGRQTAPLHPQQWLPHPAWVGHCPLPQESRAPTRNSR